MKKVFTILFFAGLMLINYGLIMADDFNLIIPQNASSPAPGYTPMSPGGQKCLPKSDLWERIKQGWGRTKELIKDGITLVGCSVNTAARQYNDESVDLAVKVPGGSIPVFRIYQSINTRSHPISMTFGTT